MTQRTTVNKISANTASNSMHSCYLGLRIKTRNLFSLWRGLLLFEPKSTAPITVQRKSLSNALLHSMKEKLTVDNSSRKCMQHITLQWTQSALYSPPCYIRGTGKDLSHKSTKCMAAALPATFLLISHQ